MKPDTFIILTPGFPENEADSTCLPSLQLFVKQLKKEAPLLNIVILSLQYPFTAGEYNWNECSVIALAGKGRSKFFRFLLWRKAWKKLKQLTKENNTTGILSFWCGEAALIGHRFGNKYSISHYCWILGQDAKKENNYIQRIKPLSSELIALSDFIQKEFEKNHGIKPQHVIPLGIDPGEFPEENHQREIDILGAGSLIPLKQYEIFIEIIKDFKEQYPGIKAVICGKGPEEKNLKGLLERYGLQKNIIMAGELSHPEVLQYMKRSKVFLHTSRYEGFGVVCIEALCAGTPVISFCKPMDAEIPGWHIVQTKEEMLKQVRIVLSDLSPQYKSVVPYTMTETVKKIMQLFPH